jgi:NADH-quinone oxidoreductase subunit K
MNGPNVAWYIAIAAVLFGIGALGVLIRRNTIVVLLSLELMLNAGNLALIALARHWHNGAGQIFALGVMAIAASEVCVGLGLVVALNRRNLSLDVDKLSELRG